MLFDLRGSGLTVTLPGCARNDISIDELWTESKSFRKPIDFSKEIMDGVLTLEVNGVQELPRRYRLMRMFSVDVDQDDMGPGMYKSGCTLLEFDSV